MKHVNYLSFFLLTLFSISFISCSDDDDNKLNTGITNQSWTEGKSLEISQDNELSVSFNAAAKWVASVTSGADWCKLNTTSGTKGQSTLKLSVSTSSTTDRTARISINIDGYSPASFEVTQKGTSVPQTTEDMEINAKVDEYLREMYLWNDEYKTLNLDHNKGYEDFFYDALGSMTTNTLDKKATADGKYTLFSYIQKKNPIGSTRSTQWVKKEQTYSFGITGADVRAIGSEDNYTIYFFVQGVYPNSPAARAGIKRGSSIMQINGEKLTMNNYWQHYLDLLIPASAFSLKITEEDMEGGTQEKDISSEAMYCNPVLFSKVTTEEETPGHRIGYLVYSGFEAGYDQELFDVFKEFKSQNITDLILDLRYNGGGHVISANLIATCIAGAKSEGKVFTSLRYNKERMEKRNILGKAGEDAAAKYLEQNGYTIRDRNWRKNHLELDIVADKDKELIIVEVKTRSNTDYIEPQDAVNWQKIRRIVVAADAYIKHFCLDAPVRFDIITAVGEPGAFRIEHLKEAFYPPMF